MKQKNKILPLFIITLLISMSSCDKKEYYFNEGYIFGTVYHMTYLADKDLKDSIEAELNKFDFSLSTFNDKSTISKFNKSGTEGFDLSGDPWAYKVINESLKISEITEGTFDITVAPLVNAWGFGFKKSSEITKEKIDSLKKYVGYRLLRFEEKKLYKKYPEMMLDASAVAKGYSCDVIASLLERNGVKDYMIEIGGEMAIKGKNPEAGMWRIGISVPNDDSTSSNMDWQEKLIITDKCIATSGNYRRFYIKDGKKYAHTIDPATGYPIQHSLLSATVIANDCLTADALATAFMVMGVEKALVLAEKLPDVEGLFICSADSGKTRIFKTKGMEKYSSK
jgi:thiamine biosynthesis lipoprotein